jgi:hypothetical protein
MTSMVPAETDIPPISIRTMTVRGADSDDESRFLSKWQTVNTPQTRKYLKDFSVFAIRQGYDPIHPNGRFGCLLVSNGELPLYFENMSEAAAFLSKRLGPIKTKEEAEAVLQLLPDMFSYKVVTSPPRSTMFGDEERPTIENKSDWTRLFEETNKAWSLTCTVLFDPNIASCKRVTITVDRTGKMSVSKEAHIYDRGGYI